MSQKQAPDGVVSPIGDRESEVKVDISEEITEDVAEGDDDVSSIRSAFSSDLEDEGDFVVTQEFTKDTSPKELSQVLNLFRSRYGNIIAEFADVEIFIISLDGLLIELTSHRYLSWILGGQTLVIAKQLDSFLEQLSSLGGKFKLIWFSAFQDLYEKEAVLKFLRSFVEVHLLKSKWSEDIVCFKSPADPNWSTFLHELTPSLLMISVDDVSKRITNKNIGFGPLLTSIAVHALSAAIPIVHFNGLVINMCSVQCHRIEPAIVDFDGFEEYLNHMWSQTVSGKTRGRNLSHCKNVAEFWAEVIKQCKKRKKTPEKFEQFACAVLVSALASERLNVQREYLPKSKSNVKDDSIKGTNCHNILKECAEILDTLDTQSHPLPFNLDDLWDGRYLLGICDEVFAKKKILPLRLQEEFARLHGIVDMKFSLPTDTEERLFNRPSPTEGGVTFSDDSVFVAKSGLMKEFAPEFEPLFSRHASKESSKLFGEFCEHIGYHYQQITEEFAKADEKLDEWHAKKRNKQQQKLSKWYEDFAQSLEGRGSNLLVDFARKPLYAVQSSKNGPTVQQGVKEKPKGKEGKKKKEPVKSKKEMILEANKNKKNAKVIEDERVMIAFAAKQGRNAVSLLETLMTKLETPESRATCVFEQADHLFRYVEPLEGDYNLESRRVHAVPLVGKLKDLMGEHWSYLDDKQKNFVDSTWNKLGFVKEGESASPNEGPLSLKINLLYYQLAYGGELIDIQSDPQKDPRVTGFRPDAWQREMLDAVDKYQSAVVIAPTSAGKTFVSYYCIERILRSSDEDIIVYVSPSKALINQVCGSVYARFRNKTMSGGRTLFGTLTPEYSENALNCQVLITVPECLEKILLSSDRTLRAVASRIKYAIFDEVHCISASPEAHIWEHLLLLIQCPFLALSATIGNAEALHNWLETTENSKAKRLRKVALIRYSERYSELELFLQRIKAKDPDATITSDDASEADILESLMPYGVFKPMKLAMFGIPADQQLTAKQVLELYRALADVDPSVKEQFEPCKFYGYQEGEKYVWLTRAKLRELESGLKARFIEWLQRDEDKMNKVLARMGRNVQKELEYRSRPFDQLGTALKNIVPVVLELRQKEQLPAICFNDDRAACERLANKLFEYFEEEQSKFEETPEFKAKFELKDEEKLLKLAKRKRDAKEKRDKIKTKGGKRGEDTENNDAQQQEDVDDFDPLAAQRLKLRNVLARYRLHVRHYDEELVTKIKERMSRGGGKYRESTKLLLKLFERGIAFHHEGLSATERGSIEILFRSGYLGMLFSTSTLALGINMPCKTVLFGVDTPYLTPLQFRQMSGRAGRRGFDHSGNVIFMSIPTAKMRRLLTASLSTLRGNLPFTTTYVLRLFTYVYENTNPTAELGALESTKAFEKRMKTALALLKNSFILHTRPERKESLQKQTKLFTLFSVQLLRWLDLLDAEGMPTGLAPVVCHLSVQEPGNLAFVYLLQKGVFHKLCAPQQQHAQKSPLEIKRILVRILAHLFTNVRLPLSWNPDDKSSYPSDGDATIFLEDLPEECSKYVGEYNAKVEKLWADFMTLMKTDSTLQIRKDVFSLSDRSSFSLSSALSDFVPACPEEFLFDEGLFPAQLVDRVDHRENKVYRNAYAYDFWMHGSKKMLNRYNNIEERHSWFMINDFHVVLERIAEGLAEVSKPNDPFTKTMKELSEEYEKKWRTSYGMRKKF